MTRPLYSSVTSPVCISLQVQVVGTHLTVCAKLVLRTVMECCVEKKVVVSPLTEEELDAVTVVFHQYETGLREGTIYTRY